MFEDFYGLLVKITLTNGDSVQGTVSSIEQNGSFITLINANVADLSGSKKHFAERIIKGVDVADLDVIDNTKPSSQTTSTPPKSKQSNVESAVALKRSGKKDLSSEKSMHGKPATPLSWKHENVMDFKNEDFDFEHNLKRFDKAKYTQQQLAILTKSDAAKQKTISIEQPGSVLENESTALKEQQTKAVTSIEKKFLDKVLPKSRGDETAHFCYQMGKLTIRDSSFSLPLELRIENASNAAVFYFSNRIGSLMESFKIHVFCHISCLDSCALAIAIARQCISRFCNASACVYLQNELFCYDSGVLVQLKYFHESGGEIVCIESERLAEFTKTSSKDIVLLTESSILPKHLVKESYGVCTGNLDLDLVNNCSQTFAASLTRCKNVTANRVVMLLDGERYCSDDM